MLVGGGCPPTCYVRLCLVVKYVDNYVGGSSKIQTLSHDSSSIEIEVYNNGTTHRLLKLLPMCRYITNYYIYYPEGVSHTHFN